VIRIALDAPGASVTSGDSTIRGGQTLSGSLAHFGGTLVLEGRVDGDVTAVGSQVYVRPGAAVGGNLTVVGGGFYSTTMAEISGTSTWLREER
jgi:cytoskeletal protein CcmA (bactofilin family)